MAIRRCDRGDMHKSRVHTRPTRWCLALRRPGNGARIVLYVLPSTLARFSGWLSEHRAHRREVVVLEVEFDFFACMNDDDGPRTLDDLDALQLIIRYEPRVRAVLERRGSVVAQACFDSIDFGKPLRGDSIEGLCSQHAGNAGRFGASQAHRASSVNEVQAGGIAHYGEGARRREHTGRRDSFVDLHGERIR